VPEAPREAVAVTEAGRTLLARSLIGRDGELAALQQAWREGGVARIVTADAGVGKSRLVRELATWAAAQGGLGIIGRCSPTGRDTPLRPWREALLGGARAGRAPGADLAPFVPALARLVPEWGEAAEDGSALVLGEAVLRLLASWAPPGTTALLVLEDLHWADPESVAVLEYVVDNLADTPVLVVATLRLGEPGPGVDLAAALVARRAAVELRLGPLSDADVLAVARSCLADAELPEAAAAALVARCDGVPFLVEELLATAVRSGWETITDDVPGSVAASVETRLADLRPATRPLLTAAALLGRHFDWNVAAHAAGVTDQEATELLRLCVQAQLVDVEGAGFRFRHALTRDAVLAAALPADVADLARRTLDALLEGDPGRHDTAVAAQLAFTAGHQQQAAELWLEAADAALRADALATAAALAQRARDAADDVTRRSAELVLLRSRATAGDTTQATELGRRMLAELGGDEHRADVHLVLSQVDLVAGRWDDAEAHAASARALAANDPARLAQADALAAQAAMGRAEPDLAVTLARSALDGARATGQAVVECEALEVIGRAERGRDLDAAEAAFQAALDRATEAGLRVHRARAMQELGTIDMFESLRADRLVAARQLAVEAGALAMAATVDLQLAAVHDARGEAALALDVARRSEEASLRWGLSTLPMAILVQGFVHATLGDRSAAEATVAAALATGQDRHHIEARAEGNVRARLAVVAGDLPAAVACLDRAMDLARAHPGATHVFPGEWALLRTILGEGDAARAEVAALAADTPVSRRVLRLADAVAAGRAGRTEEARTSFGELDDVLDAPAYAHHRAYLRHLVAPAAHADGWGAPEAWLRESLATFEGNGHDALAARCRTLLKELGAPVPRRGRGDTAAVPPALAALGITSREADVLALVADGATNREVAERLFISPRTVDKHVERLLQKAATTRAGLADLAQRAGLRT
jgi:DNA-binding CsgD family transcriptional regulator